GHAVAVVVEAVAERLAHLVVAAVARDSVAGDPPRGSAASPGAARADALLERAGGRREIGRVVDRAVAVVVEAVADLAHRSDFTAARAPRPAAAGLGARHARADIAAAGLRVAVFAGAALVGGAVAVVVEAVAERLVGLVVVAVLGRVADEAGGSVAARDRARAHSLGAIAARRDELLVGGAVAVVVDAVAGLGRGRAHRRVRVVAIGAERAALAVAVAIVIDAGRAAVGIAGRARIGIDDGSAVVAGLWPGIGFRTWAWAAGDREGRDQQPNTKSSHQGIPPRPPHTRGAAKIYPTDLIRRS